MIWVLVAIFTVLAIVFGILASAIYDMEEIMAVFCGIFIVALVIALCIGLFSLVPQYKQLNYIDTKIEYLTEENAKIDEDIKIIISSYQDHEKEFYQEFENVSASTLITLYPEIKSNELVNKQIEIYFENQKEIKELELKKIDGGVIRWWMNFGG